MGLVFAQATAEYPVVRLRPGWAETGPHAWLSATAAAVRQCLTKAEAVPLAVGLSGQMHGVVVTDEMGEPVRPAILSSDMRATQYLDTYRELPDVSRARLANPITAGMAGPTLAWLAEFEPRNWARTRWALQPKDWLRAQLTDQFFAEPSDASGTLLYDVTTDEWSADVLAALGVRPDVMPVVLAHSSDRAGYVTKRAAKLFGLPPGIPVAAGAADTAAAALGSGLVETGQAQLTIGGGAQLITPIDEIPAPPSSWPVTHLYRAATDHGWYALGAVLSAGHTLDWVRRVLGASWSDLDASAAMPPRTHDPIFLPHLSGQRTPCVGADMAGTWTGMRTHHGRQDLLRSALEGVAFAIKVAADQTLSSDRPPQHLRLAGGCTDAKNWQQMLADILGYPLKVPDRPAVPGHGAALLAARAADLVDEQGVTKWVSSTHHVAAEPRPRFQSLYQRRYETYNNIIARLRPDSEHHGGRARRVFAG